MEEKLRLKVQAFIAKMYSAVTIQTVHNIQGDKIFQVSLGMISSQHAILPGLSTRLPGLIASSFLKTRIELLSLIW